MSEKLEKAMFIGEEAIDDGMSFVTWTFDAKTYIEALEKYASDLAYNHDHYIKSIHVSPNVSSAISKYFEVTRRAFWDPGISTEHTMEFTALKTSMGEIVFSVNQDLPSHQAIYFGTKGGSTEAIDKWVKVVDVGFAAKIEESATPEPEEENDFIEELGRI